MLRNLPTVGLILFSFTLTSCQSGDKVAAVGEELVKALPSRQGILEIDGEVIRAGDLKATIDPEVARARESLVKAYLKAAEDRWESALQERIAKKEGFSSAALWKESLKAQLRPTPKDVTDFISRNNIKNTDSAKVVDFISAERVRLKIEQLTRAELAQKQIRALIRTETPAAPGWAPYLGSAQAKDTIEVYCGFSNPICGSIRIGLEQIRQIRGDKIKIVFRYFDPQPSDAATLAEKGVYCAASNSAAVELQNELYNQQATLTPDRVTQLLKSKITPKDSVDACLQGQGKTRLEAERLEAKNAGISSTPTFVLNGRSTSKIDELLDWVRQL